MGELWNNEWLSWTLTALYAATALGIIGVVLSENRNPVKSLAWVTVLFMFPLVGIVLYIFFGRSIRGARMISRRKKRRMLQGDPSTLSTEAVPIHYSPEARQQIALARNLGTSLFYTDCRIEMFADGAGKFARLKEDLRHAREFIHLQYYIFEDDDIGTQIADILCDRAAAGVKIRVIYDHIGSIHVSSRFFKRLTEAGVEVYPFFKVAFPLFATRINWRNHRKLVVIDGTIGYVGGMNIADRYIDGGRFGHWRDIHLRLTGNGVAGLHYSFVIDWHFMGRPFIDIRPNSARPASASDGTPAAVQYVTSGPTGEWSNVETVLLKAIGNARRRVYIQTPYFLPPDSMLSILQAAALSRVDVRVIMPRHSDSRILTYAGRSYIHRCLRAGIKIYFYQPGMLHSKVVIIDDDFCSVGSANIDFRSFEHNFEGNLMIYSRQFNAVMRKQFAEDMAACTRITLHNWRNRPLHHKVLESLLRLLSPVL